MTKAFFDSAYPPSAAQIAAAKAAGFVGWNGYFAGPHILNGWTKADFDRVKAGGLATLAYCSGWSSASAMRAQSLAWGVKICLDVEGGIRSLIDPDDHEYLKLTEPREADRRKGASPWVQPWLTAAGAGVYGNYWIHPGLRAAFYILAAYPTSGDPTYVSWATAYGPRPGPLCGWQWAGSHNFAGRTVDSNWFDDALYTYLGGAAPAPVPVPPKPETGDDTMLYVGDFHKLPSPVTLTVFADGQSSMPDPVAPASAPPAAIGALKKGATIQVDGYVYSSSPVQSTNPAGSDYAHWHATSGQWVTDAVMDTSSLSNAPKFAATNWAAEHMAPWPRVLASGVTIEQVRAELDKLQIVRKA